MEADVFYCIASNCKDFQQEKLEIRFPKINWNSIFNYEDEKIRKNKIIARLLLNKVGKEFYGIENLLEKTSFYSGGKPTSTNSNLHFSWTHDEILIVLAISRTAQVGIDVAYVNEIDIGLMDDYLSLEEKDWVKNSKSPLQTFYKIWTRKEALLKALGKGISDVCLNEIDTTRNCIEFSKNKVFLYDLKFKENYQLTLATLQHETQIKLYPEICL